MGYVEYIFLVISGRSRNLNKMGILCYIERELLLDNMFCVNFMFIIVKFRNYIYKV